MPDQATHLKQAKRNLAFIEECKKNGIDSSYPEWIVTAQFYAALHIVEAICAPSNIHFTQHAKRNEMIYSLTTLFDADFCSKYNDLHNSSYKARYLTQPISKSDIADCKVHLEQIINFARSKHELILEVSAPKVASETTPALVAKVESKP